MVSPLKKVSSTSLKRAMTNKGASRSSIVKRIGTRKTVHVYERKDGAIKTKRGRFALYSSGLDKKRKGKAYSKKHPTGSGRYKHTRDGVKNTGKESFVQSIVRPLGSVSTDMIRQRKRR